MQPIDFRKASYTLAAHLPKQWPEDVGNEVAFAGRSNVGKSSAINAICDQRGLAKTSKTPGRTQQIVFFDIDETYRLVDLPGYGYAKAPTELRRHWEIFLTDYLRRRECLRGLIIPMDIRRPLTELDRSMLGWCWEFGLAAHVLLTKADKFKQGKAKGILLSTRRELADAPNTTIQLFSSLNKQGVDEARTHIQRLLQPKEIDQTAPVTTD